MATCLWQDDCNTGHLLSIVFCYETAFAAIRVKNHTRRTDQCPYDPWGTDQSWTDHAEIKHSVPIVSVNHVRITLNGWLVRNMHGRSVSYSSVWTNTDANNPSGIHQWRQHAITIRSVQFHAPNSNYNIPNCSNFSRAGTYTRPTVT